MDRSIKHPWWALLGLSLASFLGCIDFTIVNTALPAIQQQFSVSVPTLQWVMNAFFLGLSATMVVAGRLADIHGRRMIFYVGLAIFAVASLLAGIAPNYPTLIIGRILQSLGVAVLYTAPMGLITSIFPESLRGRAAGFLFGANGMGLALGPIIGGFIVSFISWRYIFLVNIPLIVLSVIVCLKTLNVASPTNEKEKIDWLGMALLIIAPSLLVYGIMHGAVAGFQHAETMIILAVAVIALVGFYFVEERAVEPIVDFDLFIKRAFFGGCTANFLLAFFYSSAFFVLPLFLHSVFHFKADEIGLTLLPGMLLVGFLSPVSGHLLGKFGVKHILSFGFVCLAVSALIQTLFFVVTPNIVMIIVAMLFFGCGWAFILSPSFVAAIGAVPEENASLAMGTVGTLHNLGAAIGLAIASICLHVFADRGHFLQGFSSVMLLLIIVSVSAFVIIQRFVK